MKVCRVCGEQKSNAAFYADGARLRTACKDCTKQRRCEYYRANREACIASVLRYQQSPDVQIARREWHRERAKSQAFKAYARGWAKTPKGQEARRNRVNAYGKRDKGRAAAKRRNAARRSREAFIVNTLTAAEWASILVQHFHQCAYCGTPFTDRCLATQDHVIPLSRGGNHTLANVVPACKPCNSRKKDNLWQTS